MDGPKKAIRKRPKFLSGKRLTKFQTNVKKIAHLKGKILKEILRFNRQSMTGKKDILFAKVAHGLTFGRIPRCPNCKSGRPYFNLLKGNYKCAGYQDDEDYIECGKIWTYEEMKPMLTKWEMKAGQHDASDPEEVELDDVSTVSAGSTVMEDITEDEEPDSDFTDSD